MRRLLRKWWFGEEDQVAIDIQGARLMVVSGRGPCRSQYRSHVVPQERLTETLRHGVVTDIAGMSAILRAQLRDIDLSYTRMAVSLSTLTTFITRLPGALDCSISDPEGVERHALECLSLERSNHTVRVVPYCALDGSARYLAIVTRREVVRAWQEVAGELGVDLTVMIPRAFLFNHFDRGTWNACPDDEPFYETTLDLDLTEERATLSISRGEALLQSIGINGGNDEAFSGPLSAIEYELARVAASLAGRCWVRVLCECTGSTQKSLSEMFVRYLPDGEISFVSDLFAPAQALVRILGEHDDTR